MPGIVTVIEFSLILSGVSSVVEPSEAVRTTLDIHSKVPLRLVNAAPVRVTAVSEPAVITEMSELLI